MSTGASPHEDMHDEHINIHEREKKKKNPQFPHKSASNVKVSLLSPVPLIHSAYILKELIEKDDVFGDSSVNQ